MEVSIHELLAAAREAVKSDYIKGESILCETRYHPDTHCMVEIELLKICLIWATISLMNRKNDRETRNGQSNRRNKVG